MNSFLCMVLVVSAVSCAKNMKYEGKPYDAAYQINLDMIGRDTGTTWRVDEVLFQFGKLPSIYDKYLPDYKASIVKFTGQRFIVKSQGIDNGIYAATDSLSQLLRIPPKGKFIIKEPRDRTTLSLDIQGDSSEPWVAFKKLGAGGFLFPGNRVEGWRSYQINDMDYHVEFTLVPLQAPR